MENKREISYDACAPVSAQDMQSTGKTVVFYQLEKKFVDNDYSIPEQSKDVMYYALSVGHHTGVIDCFAEKLRCPLDVYERAVKLFEEESAARYKLEGIIRSSEIQVDKSHLPVLLPAFREVCGTLQNSKDAPDEVHANTQTSDCGFDDSKVVKAVNEVQWVFSFTDLLEKLEYDNAAYIMGRIRET